LAAVNAEIATKPSPPGRFSTTIDLPQRAASGSASIRAPMSIPLPAPNGRIHLTVRCGQTCAKEDCASDGVAAPTSTTQATTAPTMDRAMCIV
jgi:hypothetical protein